jgi:hypothetical protein
MSNLLIAPSAIIAAISWVPQLEYRRMAQVKSRKYPPIECGDIYFLYRPAVGVDEVHGFKDVRRLYILLKPWGTQIYRLLIVGRKKLPAPEEHDRFWAFVWRVFNDRAALNAELGYEEYETKTRGVRKIPPARPAAEGIYAIVRHGEHTHLAYFLELPKRQGPVERELNIKREASYIVAVKNPETPSPPNTGLGRKQEAEFPKELQEKFEGRRFVPVDPPDFLNYEGAEVVLIGASENAEQELGIEFRADEETECTADVLDDLKLPREIVREPLFEGQWK